MYIELRNINMEITYNIDIKQVDAFAIMYKELIGCTENNVDVQKLKSHFTKERIINSP